MFVARAENCQTKHFLHTLHTAVFPAAFPFSYPKKNTRYLSVAEGTIFLRSVYPVLPVLSQVPPVYSRLSLHGLWRPFHSRRLYTSVTAHSSMPVQQDLFIDYRFCRTVIPLSFPILSTAMIFLQSKIWHQEKIKKKKVKVCCQENAPTISSRKRFFRKSFVALKFSPKIFLKKYCVAFSFQAGGALSFSPFFLLKNFSRSKIF